MRHFLWRWSVWFLLFAAVAVLAVLILGSLECCQTVKYQCCGLQLPAAAPDTVSSESLQSR